MTDTRTCRNLTRNLHAGFLYKTGGSSPMVTGLVRQLRKLVIPDSQIIIEDFNLNRERFANERNIESLFE